MKICIKKWPDETATLTINDGAILWYFSSFDAAVEAVEWVWPDIDTDGRIEKSQEHVHFGP